MIDFLSARAFADSFEDEVGGVPANIRREEFFLQRLDGFIGEFALAENGLDLPRHSLAGTGKPLNDFIEKTHEEIRPAWAVKKSRLLPVFDEVDHAVCLGFLGGHETIAIRVGFDLVHGMSGVICQDFVQRLADAQHFFGLDLNI